MFAILFALALIALLILDRIFLPKSAHRAWTLMAVTFSLAAVSAIFTKPLEELAHALGVGRPVDLVIYILVIIGVREFFIARVRHRELHRELTRLVRELAMEKAKVG